MHAITDFFKPIWCFDMNFFKLYIGDYQRDTGTLTLAEHGAYVLMLQHLYATEKPLPTGRELHRLLRAENKAERDAIDNVACRFWRLADDGLVNDRALEEIKKREHQATVNREIGKRGGRPKKSETQPNGNRMGFDSEPNDNPNHSHKVHLALPSHEEDGGHYPVDGRFDCDPATGELRGAA